MEDTQYDDMFVSAKNFRKPAGIFKYFPLSKKMEILSIALSIGATAIAVVFVALFINEPGTWANLVWSIAYCVAGLIIGPLFLWIGSRAKRKLEAVYAAVESSTKSMMSFDEILSAAPAVKSKKELVNVLARLFIAKALQMVWVNIKKELVEKVRQ